MSFSIKLPGAKAAIETETAGEQKQQTQITQSQGTASPQLGQLKPTAKLIIPGKTPATQPTQEVKQPAPASAATPTGIKIPGVNAPSPQASLALSANIDATQFQFASQTQGMSEASMDSFKENLELLRGSFENKEMIAQVIRRVLGDLDAHPEFEEIMAPQDFGLMVRFLRESYNVALVQKEVKSKGASTRKKAAAAIQGTSFDLSALGNILMDASKK